MKKLIFVLIGVVLINQFVQAQARFGKMEFNKIEQPAIVGDFNYSIDLVSEVILADMKEKGFKKYDTKKGFTLFEGILFTQLSSEKIDFYFNISEKKKEKNITVLTFLISKGYDNFVSTSPDSTIFSNAKTYMNSLIAKCKARKLELDIEVQQTIYNQAKTYYETLIGEGESLAKMKTEIEESIKKNKKSQEEQKKLLEKEKENLESLQKLRN